MWRKLIYTNMKISTDRNACDFTIYTDFYNHLYSPRMVDNTFFLTLVFLCISAPFDFLTFLCGVHYSAGVISRPFIAGVTGVNESIFTPACY